MAPKLSLIVLASWLQGSAAAAVADKGKTTETSVFLSKTKHSGDFSHLPGGPSDFCKSEAEAAQLSGEWCAVLGLEGPPQVPTSQACSISYPVVMAGGIEVDSDNIFNNKALVNRDQFGDEVNRSQDGSAVSVDFWSGTSRTCNDWKGGYGWKGEIGRINKDGTLQIQVDNKICGTALPVLCTRAPAPPPPPPAPTPSPIAPSIFLSKGTHSGDFSQLSGGASEFCKSEAQAASLGGRWCAVLGTEGPPRVGPSQACALRYPLRMAGGTWVDSDDIFGNSAIVNRDQFGDEVNRSQDGSTVSVDFWSGTSRTCSDWTAGDASVKGEIGRINKDGTLQIQVYNKPCHVALPVLCVREMCRRPAFYCHRLCAHGLHHMGGGYSKCYYSCLTNFEDVHATMNKYCEHGMCTTPVPVTGDEQVTNFEDDHTSLLQTRRSLAGLQADASAVAPGGSARASSCSSEDDICLELCAALPLLFNCHTRCIRRFRSVEEAFLTRFCHYGLCEDEPGEEGAHGEAAEEEGESMEDMEDVASLMQVSLQRSTNSEL